MADAVKQQQPNPTWRERPRYAYPMLLDVIGRRVVIIGGGAVALRKVAGLIDAGARPQDLCVVSPDVRQSFPSGVEVRPQPYEPDVLEGAQLVFAATDSPAVNERVVLDARSRGILVCRVDVDQTAGAVAPSAAGNASSSDGDFVTPAKLARGPVVVTVAAAGSPALAAMIRDEFAARFDDRWARMAAAMQTLRPEIQRNAALTIETRRQIFRELASPAAMDVIGDRDGDEAVAVLRAWLRQRHSAL